MATGLTSSAFQAVNDQMRPDNLLRIVEADWITKFGSTTFSAVWDPAKGLFGFLTDLALPPELSRLFDAVPTNDGELHFWWRGQQMPALKEGWDFTVRPTVDLNIRTDWDLGETFEPFPERNRA